MPLSSFGKTSPAEILALSPVIPVIVIKSLEKVLPLAEALLAGGIPIVEITLRTPIALDAIQLLAKTFPKACIGAGTVTTVRQLDAVKEAGAKFAISPGNTSKLLQTAKRMDFPFIPGIASVCELMAVLDLGYTHVKFFPAELSGGVKMLRTLNTVFPQARFFPSGGIQAENYEDYLTLPNVSCVGGSWIASEEMIEKEQWSLITELSKGIKQSKVYLTA